MSKEQKRPRLVGMNHIALEVGDIEEALAFYGKIFDFTLRSKSKGAAFIDMGAARDDLLLGGPMALHFRRGALDPQQLGGKAEARPVVEIDLERLLRRLQADLHRPVRRAYARAHRRRSSGMTKKNMRRPTRRSPRSR